MLHCFAPEGTGGWANSSEDRQKLLSPGLGSPVLGRQASFGYSGRVQVGIKTSTARDGATELMGSAAPCVGRERSMTCAQNVKADCRRPAPWLWPSARRRTTPATHPVRSTKGRTRYGYLSKPRRVWRYRLEATSGGQTNGADLPSLSQHRAEALVRDNFQIHFCVRNPPRDIGKQETGGASRPR